MPHLDRLNAVSLARLRRDGAPKGVTLLPYDRSAVKCGLAHIGPGAFFRAHQASYIDRLLASDPRWGITAVCPNNPAVRDALAPQDGLYAVAEIAETPRLRVTGAVKRVLVAPEDPQAFLAVLASPDVRLVTMTVTEKGYRLTADGELDLADNAVAHDLAYPGATPRSLVGWLTRGLAARKAAGSPPMTLMSCDNLADNGGKLARAVRTFAEAGDDHDLAAWLTEGARFPRTMVDSITPATDAPLRELVDRTLGLHDAWPVQREPFMQWVIEDDLAPGGPDLASVGATLTRDVTPFEQAKLRLLNGAHSTLAYLGRLAGLETVSDAMAEPELAAFVERLMRDTIAPTLSPSPDLDVHRYVDDILARFRNPALRHGLAQIAWDGSKKLPPRLLGTAADLLAAGRDVAPLALPIAGWMRFIRLQAERGAELVDPHASALTARLSDGGPGEARALLACEAVFPPALAEAPPFREAVMKAHAALAGPPLLALTR